MKMDEDRKNKITAAISAVTLYIKTGEEAMMQAPLEPEPAGDLMPVPFAMASVWGISGRTDQMQLRSMMQMKAFHRMR